jgi:hypothetical protein
MISMANNSKNVSSQSAKRISVSLKRVEGSLGVHARRGVATTPAQRRAIKASPLSYRKLAGLLHVNVKTIAKWKHSSIVHDLERGPRGGKSRSLTEQEEDEIAYYYAASGKSIDKCLKDLSKRFPSITRSTYYRCIKRVRDFDRRKFAHLHIMASASRWKKRMNWSSNDDE